MTKPAQAEDAEGTSGVSKGSASSGAASLRELYESGRTAWPGIALSEEAFAWFAGASARGRGDRRRGREEPPVAIEDSGVKETSGRAIDPARAGDLYIACACAEGAPGALEAFDRRYLGDISATLARIDRGAAFADEVRQRVREKLLLVGEHRSPKIAEYGGQGSLEGWVRVVVIRAALDLRRSAKPDAACEEEALADVAAPGDDVELSLIKAHYRKEFKEAFEIALESLSTRERSVLRLHLLDGLNIEQIGALYQAHRATVARWIAGSRKKLDSATREALAAKLKLGEQELASLLGLVQSQLEVSLSRLLVTRER